MTTAERMHANVEEAASDWIERRDREGWSSDQQAQLDIWLNEALAHRIAFWRLEAAWSRTERLAALRPGEIRRDLLPSAGSAPRNILKFAAAIGIVAIVGGAVATYLRAPDYQTYATTIGGREILTLRDGSVIELSTDTVVRLSDSAQQRTVRLEKGEAYFNIRHDAAHPFVVMVGDHRVTDLGTKFLVRRDVGRMRVALYEGSAQIDAVDSSQAERSVVLTPGEVAVATADSLSVSKQPARALSDALGWRRGQLVFYHTTLGDAVAEFNRYNRTQIKVGDAHTARLVVNGSFPTNGIAAFTETAQQVFAVHVEHHGDEIVVSR